MPSKFDYDVFKHSACFSCGYCKESHLPDSRADELDVRKTGLIKIWCYAANDVMAVMTAMEKEECPYRITADNE